MNTSYDIWRITYQYATQIEPKRIVSTKIDWTWSKLCLNKKVRRNIKSGKYDTFATEK